MPVATRHFTSWLPLCQEVETKRTSSARATWARDTSPAPLAKR